MAHYCICKNCGERFDRDKIPFVEAGKRRYAHAVCPENPKPYVAEKPPAEKSERVQFTDYVQDLFGKENCNWGMIAKQMKQYTEEYHYTYSGMQKTLEWYYNVQKKPKNNKNGGIGIIPYNYKQAYDYYYKIFQAEQINQNIEVTEAKQTEIKIAKPVRKPARRIKTIEIHMEDCDEE